MGMVNMENLYKTTFEDLDLPSPTRTGMDTIDFSEMIDDCIDNIIQYEGTRIGGSGGSIVMAICPECCGNSCADADYENGEDSCNGSYNFDCDQGEMSNASWISLYKYESFQNALKARMAERTVVRS